MTEDKSRKEKFLSNGKKFLFSTFRFETQFKIEFLGLFTVPRNPLKKFLHIFSISPPNFIFRNKIICFKTKIFSGIVKQQTKWKRNKINPSAEPSTAIAKGKINLTWQLLSNISFEHIFHNIFNHFLNMTIPGFWTSSNFLVWLIFKTKSLTFH